MCVGNKVDSDSKICKLSMDARETSALKGIEISSNCTTLYRDENLHCEFQSENNLNILHLNIHSLSAKRDNLVDMLHWLENESIVVHIIKLCETYITDNNKDFCRIPGYTMYSKNRTHRIGGGVAILIKNHLSSSEVVIKTVQYCEREFEFVCCKINANKNTLIVCEIYRAPGTSINNFLDAYKSLTTELNRNNCPVLISGDFNIDLLKCNKERSSTDFLDCNLENNFVPCIFK